MRVDYLRGVSLNKVDFLLLFSYFLFGLNREDLKHLTHLPVALLTLGFYRWMWGFLVELARIAFLFGVIVDDVLDFFGEFNFI